MGSSRSNNRLSGTVFYAKFPGSIRSLIRRASFRPSRSSATTRTRRCALSDTHIFGSSMVNEIRGGMFYLDNTRQLDDPFLDITNDERRHPESRQQLRHEQRDDETRPLHRPPRRDDGTVLVRRAERQLQQAGAAHLDDRQHAHLDRRHRTRCAWGASSVATNSTRILPEEQATEFEKFDNFTMFLRGLGTEGDTQFGITDKRFRFNDFNLFLADDWRVGHELTINAGVRYEFFGLPDRGRRPHRQRGFRGDRRIPKTR